MFVKMVLETQQDSEFLWFSLGSGLGLICYKMMSLEFLQKEFIEINSSPVHSSWIRTRGVMDETILHVHF